MRRNGGTALIRSGPEGTEVRLALPLSLPGAEAGTNTNQASEHP
ncbi:hypothetical protein [Arthrobacter sp. zg-Y1219]